MDVLMLLLLPLFFLLMMMTMRDLAAAAADDHGMEDCPISKCSGGGHADDGPVIQFPFRLKHHPLHCGHPEFEVFCVNNMTMIQLSPSSGLFPIRNIDYSTRSFDVYDDDDADGCLLRRLLNFTISTSSLFQPAASQLLRDRFSKYPFQKTRPMYNCAYYVLLSEDSPYLESDMISSYAPHFTEFILLNCSTAKNFSAQEFGFKAITCLSAPGHQVLAVPSYTSVIDLPVPTCSTLSSRKLLLPLENQYPCEPDNVLLLKWESMEYFPRCQNCTEEGGRCEFNDTTNQIECYPHPIFPHPQQYPQGHVSTRHIIIGVSLACCFVLISVMAVAIFFYVKQQRNSIEEKENQIKVEKFLNDHKSHVPTRYSHADIKKITNGFKKKLGEGGFGSVFRGKLPNGVPVAVKVLGDSKGNGEDFVNEVGTIGRIHHVNVVRLLGFSAEAGKRAVIYELMPNRSLEKFISSKDQSNNALFDWEKLDNIVNGIAKGIEYLHQGCEQRILHFDIKPHNILLDHDFNPKISDFGVAKLCSKEDSIISMTAARGTVGYIAPEVFNGNFGSVSHKSDVYSFGMLVLEIVGARKEAALTSGITNEAYFPELIYKCLIQGEALGLELINTDEDAEIAKKLVIVALWCIQWYPVNRPSMKAVVRMLEGASENLIMPPNPFASATSTQSQTEQPKTTESS
ncbi:hypothetical protein PRUPE_6G352900 [Prunus persica]|uniref:Protein kinase domain-containing protein n=1 Tax=Prunus persica TaxID=3760 RepID=A0A251P0F5_PRUPE|nr:hypothetical protein PRUPE_6G352900 [Prunus persica]